MNANAKYYPPGMGPQHWHYNVPAGPQWWAYSVSVSGSTRTIVHAAWYEEMNHPQTRDDLTRAYPSGMGATELYKHQSADPLPVGSPLPVGAIRIPHHGRT